jgi:hypothetical protein
MSSSSKILSSSVKNKSKSKDRINYVIKNVKEDNRELYLNQLKSHLLHSGVINRENNTHIVHILSHFYYSVFSIVLENMQVTQKNIYDDLMLFIQNKDMNGWKKYFKELVNFISIIIRDNIIRKLGRSPRKITIEYTEQKDKKTIEINEFRNLLINYLNLFNKAYYPNLFNILFIDANKTDMKTGINSKTTLNTFYKHLYYLYSNESFRTQIPNEKSVIIVMDISLRFIIVKICLNLINKGEIDTELKEQTKTLISRIFMKKNVNKRELPDDIAREISSQVVKKPNYLYKFHL